MAEMDQIKGKVMTVLGPIEDKNVGITLCHEHCLIDMTCNFVEPKEATARRIAYEPLSIQNIGYVRYHHNHLDNATLLDEDQAVSEIFPYKYSGGNTIVDVTNIDLARDPQALKRISLKTGLNIIMGSGYYTEKGQDIEKMNKRTEEDIAEEIIKDITVGVGYTGIHSGIIGEIGCSSPLVDSEIKTLRAATIAQKETGAPMSVHPGRTEDAPFKIIEILKDMSVNLEHVVMCHLDRTIFDLKKLYKFADAGCYLAYDEWGVEGYYSSVISTDIDILNDAQRIHYIKNLIEKGYGKKILISHDICHKCRYRSFGGHGYDHILSNAIPLMRLRNITEDQINDLLINNPKRFLTFK